MSQSQTPETDAMEYEAYDHLGRVVPVEFARKLEIERDEARAQLQAERALADRLAKFAEITCYTSISERVRKQASQALAAWKETQEP